MTIMLAEVYDALRDAGASDEEARKAAEAVAGGSGDFASIKNCSRCTRSR